MENELKGVGILRLDPKGNFYTNQAGGYACYHPKECGFVGHFGEYLSLILDNLLQSYFCSPKWNGWCTGDIDIETIYFLNAILEMLHMTLKDFPLLRVNETRCKESMEAWIYLIDFKENEGVLFWTNSD